MANQIDAKSVAANDSCSTSQIRQREPVVKSSDTETPTPKLTTKSMPAGAVLSAAVRKEPECDLSPPRSRPSTQSRTSPDYNNRHFSPSQIRAIRSLAKERQRSPQTHSSTPPPLYRQPASVELPDLETHPYLRPGNMNHAAERSARPRQTQQTPAARHRRLSADRRQVGRQVETAALGSNSKRSRSAEPPHRQPPTSVKHPASLPHTQSVSRLRLPALTTETLPATTAALQPFVLPTATLSPFTPHVPLPEQPQWPTHNRKLVRELCLLADVHTGRPIRITERFRLYVERVWNEEQSRKLSFTEFIMAGDEQAPRSMVPSRSSPVIPLQEEPHRRSWNRLAARPKKTRALVEDANAIAEKRYYALPAMRAIVDQAPHGQPHTARTPLNVRNTARLGREMVETIRNFHHVSSVPNQTILSPETMAANQQRCTDAMTACQKQIRDELALVPLTKEFQFRMAGLFSRQIGMAVTTSERSRGNMTFSTMAPFDPEDTRIYHYDAREFLDALMGRCKTEKQLGFEQQPSELLPQSVWGNLMSIDLQYCEWLLENPHASASEIKDMRASLLYQLLFLGAIFPLLRTNTNPFPAASPDFAIYEKLAAQLIHRIETDSLESARKLVVVLMTSTNDMLLPAASRADLLSRQSPSTRTDYLQLPERRNERITDWVSAFKCWIDLENLPRDLRACIATVLEEQSDNDQFAAVQMLCAHAVVQLLSNRPTPAFTDLEDPEETVAINLIHQLYTTRFEG